MMKILMIVPSPFFADRGCHVRILEEVNALTKRGHRVRICTYPLGRNIDNMDICRTLPVPWYRKLTAGPSLHKFYLDALLYITVRNCLKKEKFDIIHAHLHEGIYIADKLGLLSPPILADLQGSMTDEIQSHGFLGNRKWILNLLLKTERRLNRIPNKIILSSTQALELLRNKFNIEEDRMQVIPDGVNCDIFKPSESNKAIREKLRLPPDKKIVVFLGLLTKYQGMEALLQSIPKVLSTCRQSHFLLMGYPNEDQWRKRFAFHGIGPDHVTFTGRIPYEEAPQYLSAGDIAVSPKLSKTEANGKLLNYMAQALCTIVFDTEVNREILGDLGIYAEYDNPDSLAQCLIHAIQNEKESIERGLNLRTRALEYFSWDEQARKIENCYRKILENC
ncbi:MAG: glycosyltransferase family 4 protein [Chlamydiota bacterium]|nr:glycosyltransferase family 4 protein [Chlamydiota bacterium]